ncbi:unnamed protein product, partial [Iphiclides podalirius]
MVSAAFSANTTSQATLQLSQLSTHHTSAPYKNIEETKARTKLLLVLLIVAVVDRACTDSQCPNSSENDLEIEGVLAHQDCDKFYKCFQGKPLEVLCPKWLFFDLKNLRCDWGYNVNCSGRNIPEQSDPLDDDEITNNAESESEYADADENIYDDSEQEAVSVGLEFFQNGCPVNPTVQWRLPHEEECNQFYYCLWGMKLKRRCQPYLHFNKKIQVGGKLDFSL